MLPAQAGVNAPEDDGRSRMDGPGHPDDFLDTGVPVRHEGGHQDRCRSFGGPQFLDKELCAYSVSAIGSGHIPKDFRPGSPFPKELTGPVSAADGPDEERVAGHSRMVDVEAVYEVDAEAPVPEERGEREKTERLGPEVIGGEVVYPRVDEDEKRLSIGHRTLIIIH